MNYRFRLLSIVFLCVFLWAGNVFSTPLGTNITIYDKNSTDQDWHRADEDGEVEPGMQHGQIWDLEGFFLNGSTLTLVGGYNFLNGEAGFTSGDIFIDIDGDAVFGDIHGERSDRGHRSVLNTYGYDYVIDLNFDNGMYDVYEIDASSTVVTAFYEQNQGSSPWQYVHPQTGETALYSGQIGYNNLTNEQNSFISTYFEGLNHNSVVVDVGFLDSIAGSTFHYTMGCGNDNLMGTVPVPEPATILLFGFGMLGLAGITKKRILKK